MLIVTIFIIIITLLLINKKKSLNILINKNTNLNKINDNISNLIIKKRDLLYDICKEINKLNNKEMFTKLNKIKNEEDNFNLDRLLNGIYKDLKEYLMIIANKNKSKNNKLDYHFIRILEKEELFEILKKNTKD